MEHRPTQHQILKQENLDALLRDKIATLVDTYSKSELIDLFAYIHKFSSRHNAEDLRPDEIIDKAISNYENCLKASIDCQGVPYTSIIKED